MKFDDGMTEYLAVPVEEAKKIVKAMAKAAGVGDLNALKWCARRLAWLCDDPALTSLASFLDLESVVLDHETPQ